MTSHVKYLVKREEVIEMFPDTTVGKTTKVVVWLVVVNAVLAGLSVVLNQPDLLNPKVAGALSLVNISLVGLRNLLDPGVKNI